MDDHEYGTRNKRGDWRPRNPLKPAPVFVLPIQPLAFVKWLPRYFLPWNVLFMATALLFWFWLTPDIETLKTLDWHWIVPLLLRNMAIVLLFYGALEFRLYIRRRQRNLFKYNAKWPSEQPNRGFMFNSQTVEGIIWTFCSALPIWTLYEVLVLWVFANGWVPWLSWTDNLVWLTCFGLLIPLIHEFHFYLVHRLIHIPVLYRWVHSVHHRSVNPSPWSSLSMHPVEHLLYWSGALIHLIVPSHPLLAMYHIHVTGLGAVVGHIGFDKMVVGDDRLVDTNTYAHYLHHKYFEVNYADGLIPLDRIFGTWHDGTSQADDRMNARRQARAARTHAKPV